MTMKSPRLLISGLLIPGKYWINIKIFSNQIPKIKDVLAFITHLSQYKRADIQLIISLVNMIIGT